jgi:hypothetical protein
MTMWKVHSGSAKAEYNGPSSLPRRAEQAAEIDDMAEETVRLLGAGRGAGLDPDALTNLAQAALALGAPAATVYRAEGTAADSDTELLGDAEELERATAAALKDALDLQREAQAQYELAQREQEIAQADLSAALAMPVADPCKGACHAARERATRRAQRRIDEAIADQECCQQALEILAELIPVLRQALQCLQRVAEDLGTTYEQIYGFLGGGGQLPHDGRFFDLVKVPRLARATCSHPGCDDGVMPDGGQCPHCHGYGEVVLRGSAASRTAIAADAAAAQPSATAALAARAAVVIR